MEAAESYETLVSYHNTTRYHNLSRPRLGLTRTCIYHSVGVALGYGLEDRGPGIFLFTTASRTALKPTQPPVQWVPGALSLGVKLTTHLHLVSRSKNAWSYTSNPQYALMAWHSVKKQHRDNFTFTLPATKYKRVSLLPSNTFTNFAPKNLIERDNMGDLGVYDRIKTDLGGRL
jgi:hypothetical protein